MWTDILPLGLTLLCVEAVLLLSGIGAQAKRQQCRLQPQKVQAVVQLPNVNHPSSTSTPSSTSSSHPSSSVPPSLISIPPVSFIYGTNKVRGVNLFVAPFRMCKLTIDFDYHHSGGWLVLEVRLLG